MDEMHKHGHELRKDGNFEEAVNVFIEIWSEDNTDKWIGWEYAYCLAKMKNINAAIKICKHTYKIDDKFEMNNDLMAWCVYEKYFKNEKKKQHTQHELDKLDEIATVLTGIIKQKKGSAYEPIVFSIVEFYRKRNDSDSNKMILKWLACLDPELLSNEPAAYENDKAKGNVLELSSRKETYYSVKTKSLLALDKYSECIECCNVSKEQIQIYHYNNDIWIESRRLISKGKLGHCKEAIEGLKELSLRVEHWSLLFEIAKLYKSGNMPKEAILYSYKALLSKGKENMKVNVVLFVAERWDELNNSYQANRHYAYYRKIREENGWNTSHTIHQRLEGMKLEKDIHYNVMQQEWVSWIKGKNQILEGVVSKIMPNGKNGFIKSNGNSFFFKLDSVIGKKKVRKGSKVAYILEDSYDPSKKRYGKEARYIEIIL